MEFKFKRNRLCLMDNRHSYTTVGGIGAKIHVAIFNDFNINRSLKILEDVRKILNHENVEKIEGEFFCKDKETQRWIIDHLIAYIIEKKLTVGG